MTDAQEWTDKERLAAIRKICTRTPTDVAFDPRDMLYRLQAIRFLTFMSKDFLNDNISNLQGLIGE